MVLDKLKVLWPDRLALVCLRNDARVLHHDLKDYGSEKVAYAMGFSKEEIVWGNVEIKPRPTAQDLIPLEHSYPCPIIGAYYLSRVVVRPLEGKMLLKGNLCLRVDGESVVHGPLSTFLPDLEPIDCRKPVSWQKTKSLYLACGLTKEGAWENDHLGFMLPNLSKVEVHLNDVVAEEKVDLEIGIITAYYSTKIGDLANPNIPLGLP